MAKLFVVRHGNTFERGDTILRVGGRTDLDLSTSGVVQAETLGAHFRTQKVDLGRVFTGPLKRTLQTAAAITTALGLPPASVDERLREVDYGPDEGMPENSVVERIGKEALAAWETDATVPDGWCVDPPALIHAWRSILDEVAAAGTNAMAVTSNGVARFVFPCVAGADGRALKLKTGAYGVIQIDGANRSVEDWNIRP